MVLWLYHIFHFQYLYTEPQIHLRSFSDIFEHFRVFMLISRYHHHNIGCLLNDIRMFLILKVEISTKYSLLARVILLFLLLHSYPQILLFQVLKHLTTSVQSSAYTKFCLSQVDILVYPHLLIVLNKLIFHTRFQMQMSPLQSHLTRL